MGIDPRPRVAVLSDDRLFCEGLLRILAADQTIVVAGYATSDTLTADLVSNHPNVVLLDSRLPAALRACTEISQGGRHVVMISAPESDGWASDALDAGARGVIVKSSRTDDLFLAIHAVHDKLIWARRRVLAARIDHLSRVSSAHRAPLADPRLSVREAEVLRYAATGLGNKELADRLAITEATVKVHLTHIFQKLGLRGRTELAAAYHGLLTRARSDESTTPTR